MEGLIAVTVLVLIALFMAGVSAQGSRTPTRGKAVPNADSTDCAMAQREYARTARQACDLTSAVNAATDARASVERELVSAQIVAAGLLAGAVAAGLVPVLGQFLAPALMNAYLVAQGRVVYLLGRMSLAASLETSAIEEWRRGWEAFNAAQFQLHARCPEATATATEASSRPRCSP